MIAIISIGSVQASDIAKEKRWAAQIEDSLLDGDAVYLNDGSNDFLAIDTRAEDNSSSAVILLHGIGAHPDWPQLISPLRVSLPEQGWTTLSLQLPILPNEAQGEAYLPLMDEVAPRIEAGMAYLTQAGFKEIHVVAHSMGTAMAGYYLSTSNRRIKSYVAIGMGEINLQYLSAMSLPVYDIYGEDDLPGVKASAAERRLASKNNVHYEQKRVAGADHFFEDKDSTLLTLVTEWLGRQ